MLAAPELASFNLRCDTPTPPGAEHPSLVTDPPPPPSRPHHRRRRRRVRSSGDSSLATFQASVIGPARLAVPPEIAHVLIDQRVCASAPLLLLNAWSTFSQMVIGRVGLANRAIGWARDLNLAQQTRAGVKISFLKKMRSLAS